MNLPKRLEGIIEAVPVSGTVCDIGCDHAYVSIELIRRGRAKRVLACDVREGPLRQAQKNIEAAGLSDRIELRLGDGLSPVRKGEAETVVCAGMGGALICHILTGRLQDFQRFVLSPQSEPGRLRSFLLSQGAEIQEETLLLEGEKYYLILTAGAAGQENAGRETALQSKAAEYRDYELVYGKKLLERRDPILRGLLRQERARCAELLKKADTEALRTALRLCEEALRCYPKL